MKTHVAIFAATMAVGVFSFGPNLLRAGTNEGDDTNNSNSTLPNQSPQQTSSGLSPGNTTSGAVSDNGSPTNVNGKEIGGGALDTKNQTSRASNDLVSQKSTNGVQQALAQLTEAALSGKMSDLSQYLCDKDRARVGNANTSEAPQNDKITQFQKDWRAKFGNGFSVADASRVYGDSHVQILPGDIGESARLAGEKIPAEAGEKAAPSQSPGAGTFSNTLEPGAADTGVDTSTIGGESGMRVGSAGSGGTGTGSSAGAEGASAGPRDSAGQALTSNISNQLPPDTGANSPHIGMKDAKEMAAMPGKARATVKMEADHGQPPVSARFVNESEQWKLDIPNSMDANKIQQNLQDQLGKLDDDKANWGDEAHAQRMVTQAVLAALTDANAANGSAPTERLPN